MATVTAMAQPTASPPSAVPGSAPLPTPTAAPILPSTHTVDAASKESLEASNIGNRHGDERDPEGTVDHPRGDQGLDAEGAETQKHSTLRQHDASAADLASSTNAGGEHVSDTDDESGSSDDAADAANAANTSDAWIASRWQAAMAGLQHGIRKSLEDTATAAAQGSDLSRLNIDTLPFARGWAEGQGEFQVKSLAPLLFQSIRKAWRISASAFAASMCDRPLEPLSNPGHSGAMLFLSHDSNYIIKTIEVNEYEALLQMLPEYAERVSDPSGTLLSVFCGVFAYQSGSWGSSQNWFLVMRNLMPTDIPIHQRFDLKGSRYKRQASANERAKDSPTFKDLDFNALHPDGIEVVSDDDYAELCRAIQHDCLLLRKFSIMDYSLLVGLSTPETLPLNEVLVESAAQRRTVLVEVGGKPAVLFLGIIDILQQYSWKKKLEYAVRRSIHGRAISVRDPEYYAGRFGSYTTQRVLRHGSVTVLEDDPAWDDEYDLQDDSTEDAENQRIELTPLDETGNALLPSGPSELRQHGSEWVVITKETAYTSTDLEHARDDGTFSPDLPEGKREVAESSFAGDVGDGPVQVRTSIVLPSYAVTETSQAVRSSILLPGSDRAVYVRQSCMYLDTRKTTATMAAGNDITAEENKDGQEEDANAQQNLDVDALPVSAAASATAPVAEPMLDTSASDSVCRVVHVSVDQPPVMQASISKQHNGGCAEEFGDAGTTAQELPPADARGSGCTSTLPVVNSPRPAVVAVAAVPAQQAVVSALESEWREHPANDMVATVPQADRAKPVPPLGTHTHNQTHQPPRIHATDFGSGSTSVGSDARAGDTPATVTSPAVAVAVATQTTPPPEPEVVGFHAVDPADSAALFSSPLYARSSLAVKPSDLDATWARHTFDPAVTDTIRTASPGNTLLESTVMDSAAGPASTYRLGRKYDDSPTHDLPFRAINQYTDTSGTAVFVQRPVAIARVRPPQRGFAFGGLERRMWASSVLAPLPEFSRAVAPRHVLVKASWVSPPQRSYAFSVPHVSPSRQTWSSLPSAGQTRRVGGVAATEAAWATSTPARRPTVSEHSVGAPGHGNGGSVLVPVELDATDLDRALFSRPVTPRSSSAETSLTPERRETLNSLLREVDSNLAACRASRSPQFA